MQKIGDTTKTADSNGEFTDGDPQKQISCTWIMAAWLNTLQREVIKVVQEGGLTLNPKDDTQLYQAIDKLIGTAVKGALPLYPDTLAVDLNTLGAADQAGVYCQPQNAGATTANHYPINVAGTLLVTPSAYGCQQEYTEFTTGRKFQRSLTATWNGKDGPWGDWREYYGEGHKPTATDSQAADWSNNFAARMGDARVLTGANPPTSPGVWSVENSTWTPVTWGTLYVTTGNSDLSVTPANGKYIHYLFIAHGTGNKLFIATNVNGTFSGWYPFVSANGGTFSGQIISPSFASTPEAMPRGAGAYADQLSTQAPFFQPNWQWVPSTGGIFVPIAKGTSTRKGQGYPTAVTYGYLMPGTNEFAHPTIHVRGDNNFECAWDFNPQSGAISSKAGTVAVLDLDIPPGIIHAWPGETPPAGWLMCNGSWFNTSQCPRLAWAFPGGQLPDLRGAFLRGKDNGKGVDPNRGLLSIQPGQAPASAIGGGEWGNYAGRDTGHTVGTGSDNTYTYRVMQETEQQRETRPYNVAINYIVRAA